MTTAPIGRRRLLAALATGTVASGVCGVAGATGDRAPTSFRLGAERGGWRGIEPAYLSGQTNPTLYVEAGTEVRVTWENVDGISHSFELLDGNDEVVASTDVKYGEDASATLTFTAGEGLAGYQCGVHPASMSGEVTFGSPPTPTRTATATATGTETRTATETTTATATATRTATDAATGGTDTADGGGQGLPGPGVPGALAALAGGLWALGRRDRE